MTRYRWIIGYSLIALAAGCAFFYAGLLDQEHWTTLVRGLAAIVAGTTQ